MQVKQFLNILQKRAEVETKSVFTKSELKSLADQAGISNFYNILDSLNIQGYLLKKGNNAYQLQSVDY